MICHGLWPFTTNKCVPVRIVYEKQRHPEVSIMHISIARIVGPIVMSGSVVDPCA